MNNEEFGESMNEQITLGWSEFAIANNSLSSGNTYSVFSEQEIVDLVLNHWGEAVAGQGESTLDRKILVPIPPHGFFCPPRANLVSGMRVTSEIKTRQAGEDPYIETYVEEDEARRLNAFVEIPAKRVDVVCYSASALLENDGKRSTDCQWEIVCLLATTGEQESMMPLAMARNYLEKPGGTLTVYSAREFAESIYYWASQRGIKVKLGPSKQEVL